MSGDLLSISCLNKSFDGLKAVSDFSCSLSQGEILGLIGPNGAGKTTLFNTICGLLRPESGRVELLAANIVGMPPYRVALEGVARTFQDVRLIRRVSVLDNVLLAFRNQPGEHLGNVFFRWKMCRRCENRNHDGAINLLEQVGLAQKAHDRADDLSYGQQKLLSLVCCLAMDANLLLLDEPIAGIAPEMTEHILRIIQGLPSSGRSAILIEHNMKAIKQVCDRVIFMDSGSKVCEGTFEEVRGDPRVIEAYIH